MHIAITSLLREFDQSEFSHLASSSGGEEAGLQKQVESIIPCVLYYNEMYMIRSLPLRDGGGAQLT